MWRGNLSPHVHKLWTAAVHRLTTLPGRPSAPRGPVVHTLPPGRRQGTSACGGSASAVPLCLTPNRLHSRHTPYGKAHRRQPGDPLPEVHRTRGGPVGTPTGHTSGGDPTGGADDEAPGPETRSGGVDQGSAVRGRLWVARQCDTPAGRHPATLVRSVRRPGQRDGTVQSEAPPSHTWRGLVHVYRYTARHRPRRAESLIQRCCDRCADPYCVCTHDLTVRNVFGRCHPGPRWLVRTGCGVWRGSSTGQRRRCRYG